MERDKNGNLNDNNFDMVNEKRVITLRCEHLQSDRESTKPIYHIRALLTG